MTKKLREALGLKPKRGDSWTPERLDLLKRLWADGWSALAIANKLGIVTRSAVLGKIHRLGLARRAGIPVPPPRPRTRRSSANTPGRSGTARKAPGASVPPPVAATEAAAAAITVPESDGLIGQRAPAANMVLSTSPVSNPKKRLASLPKVAVGQFTIFHLTDRSCRFVMTDEPPFLYCGNEAFPGLPYCNDHAVRCYALGRKGA